MDNFAVIFDFNGTMLFDTPLQYRAWNVLAEETLGHGIDYDEFLRAANGRTSRETVEYFWGKDVDVSFRNTLIARKRDMYRQQCVEHPDIFHLAEGSTEVLDLLKDHEIPFTIATSSNPSSVDFYYENLDLGRWFERENIICSDLNFPGKPAPDIYQIAAKKLNMPPERCVVVEDALAGASSARAAGIGYIVVIDPYRSGQFCENELINCVIRHYGELFELLRQKIADKK